MKNILCYAFFMLLTSIGFAQNSFEKGYYVNGKGEKVEGYLQIINFENINETEKLYFKKELTDEVVKLSTDEIVEFGIGEELKFLKATFEMDDISFYKDFNNEKELQLKSVNLFLNVLVDGDASLYCYENGNGFKYFYSVKSKKVPVTQLVYKKYIFEQTIKENNAFKQQLFKDIKNDDQTFNEFVSLKYEKQALVSIFEKFNKTKNENYKVFKNKYEKSIDINVSAITGVFRLDSKLGFNFGADFELVTPSEKLGFYARLKLEKVDIESSESYRSAMGFNLNENIYKSDYKAMDLIIGLRYFLKLNTQNKIFIGAATGINSSKATGILVKRVTNGSGQTESIYGTSYSGIDFFPNFSIGYIYKNRYAADLEIDIQKTYFRDRPSDFVAKYNKIGINLRYIFN